jgi:hypothetical protein
MKPTNEQKNAKFTKWLKIFLEEKNIPLDTDIVIRNNYGDNFLTLGVVVEFLSKLDNNSQEKIQNKLVMIDFNNGNVINFMRYIAQGFFDF